jgi:citrate synthase
MTMFPVLFAIPRTSGWMAQWAEMVRDTEQKIARPRQVYIGEMTRKWIPLAQRPEPSMREDAVSDRI